MSVINATNHWSRCPWLAVEGEHEQGETAEEAAYADKIINIYTDQADPLCSIFNPEGLTADDRQLADYIIRNHNEKLALQRKAVIQ